MPQLSGSPRSDLTGIRRRLACSPYVLLCCNYSQLCSAQMELHSASTRANAPPHRVGRQPRKECKFMPASFGVCHVQQANHDQIKFFIFCFLYCLCTVASTFRSIESQQTLTVSSRALTQGLPVGPFCHMHQHPPSWLGSTGRACLWCMAAWACCGASSGFLLSARSPLLGRASTPMERVSRGWGMCPGRSLCVALPSGLSLWLNALRVHAQS